MNTDLIEPALTELVQNTRKLEGELIEQRKLLQKILESKTSGLETAALKDLLTAEMEKLNDKVRDSKSPDGKSWTLFSNDFQAQNFKVVVETILKWLTIICGSFYLIYSIVSLLKK